MIIEIKSRPIHLLFGYSAYKTLINALVKHKGKYMEEDGNFTAYGLAKIIHSAYENYCLDKDLQPAIAFDDVLEWVDNAVSNDKGAAQLAEIVNEWSASVHVKRMVEANEQKKSEQQTLSRPTSTNLNESVTESLESDPGNSGDTVSEKSSLPLTDSVNETGLSKAGIEDQPPS